MAWTTPMFGGTKDQATGRWHRVLLRPASVHGPCSREVQPAAVLMAVVAFVMAVMAFTAGLAALQRPAHALSGISEIAGQPVACRDFRGRTVVNMAVDKLGDVGFARVINTVPYILMDPEIMRTLPVKLQVFFYAHECAHHVLGHWFHPTVHSEREADCWAVRKYRDNGYLTRQDVKDFAPWLAKSRGTRFGHLPGPQRADFLLACFDGND